MLIFVSDYVKACGPYHEGVWNAVTQSVYCAPWVSWGYLNALFHVMWVGALLFSQCYQVENSLCCHLRTLLCYSEELICYPCCC